MNRNLRRFREPQILGLEIRKVSFKEFGRLERKCEINKQEMKKTWEDLDLQRKGEEEITEEAMGSFFSLGVCVRC